MQIRIVAIAAMLTAAACQEEPHLHSDVAGTAPNPHLAIDADNAPTALTTAFNPDASNGDLNISIEGAPWLQLRFGDLRLLDGETIEISTPNGQAQSFTRDLLEEWGGRTAMFRGSELSVTTNAPQDGAQRFRVIEIIVGLPNAGDGNPNNSIPAPLSEILGQDLQSYSNNSSRRSTTAVIVDGKALCGIDSRIPANHPSIGRVEPAGCTAWIEHGGRLVTAGHCVADGLTTVHFNVPDSNDDGTRNPSAIADQYPVLQNTISHSDNNWGDDWAVFQVGRNATSLKTPLEQQGRGIRASDSHTPSNVAVIGYGEVRIVNGSTGQLNQTQQYDGGPLVEVNCTGDRCFTKYSVDATRGNSGSPILDDSDFFVAIGIHRGGRCDLPNYGYNDGTTFRNRDLWNALRSSP